MTIDKGVWVWNGIPGGSGYSILYATPGMGVSGLIKTFFSSIAAALPSGVSVTTPTEGDQIDEATGTLTGVWTGGAGGTTVGTGAPHFAAPTGACVTWSTDGIVNGKRVRGRTFLVPLTGDAYQDDGSLRENIRTLMQTAVDTLVSGAAGDLLVWHRPVGGVGGSAHPVVAGRISDRAAILTSRRV